MIDDAAVEQMKKGVVIVNTSRADLLIRNPLSTASKWVTWAPPAWMCV